jgi:hypothetical protein
MAQGVIRTGLVLALAASLAACSTGSGDPARQGLLRTIGLRQPPPDEFLVVERKPIVIPPDLTDLPPPDPDGINRTDPQPQADVAALLAGAAAPATSAAPSVGEIALLDETGAAVADPGVREVLAAEDTAERSNSSRFAIRSLFGRPLVDPYRDELLDPEEETLRLRQQGLQTPAAPPPPEKQSGLTLF